LFLEAGDVPKKKRKKSPEGGKIRTVKNLTLSAKNPLDLDEIY